MTATIDTPDFEFSGFYYPELIQDLIQWLRQNVPEVTDESPEEPYIQLLRAFALTGHINNVLLDAVAKERFLPTAQLRASVRAHLALIGIRLKQASPATVEILLELSQVFAAAQLLAPAGSRFATSDSPERPAIEYEVLADVETARTDQVGAVLSYGQLASAYADHTAEAITPTGYFAPQWGTPLTPGDALYIGHPDIMWDKVQFDVRTAASGIAAAVWEFYDPNLDYTNPDVVVNNGTNLTFRLNGYLGTADRTGTALRVRSLGTGGFEDLVVTYSGGINQATTVGFLGQGAPSTDPEDYLVGSEWKPLPDVVDESNALQTLGTRSMSFTVPQSLKNNWRKTAVGATGSEVDAYWIRLRIIARTGPSTTLPSLYSVRIDTGRQYRALTAAQGVSQEDSPLGSSTGLPGQQFQLARAPVLEDASLRIFVTESAEEEWARVENFLNSLGTDKHCRVEFDEEGRGIIIFGDGLNGKIPAAGTDNIRAQYRTMEERDGNVGANTVTVNKAGIAFVNSIRNPRPGSGYAPREGGTVADLARLKVAGPASLRTLDRAVTPSDVVDLTLAYVSPTSGTRPFVRALAVEEGFGPKTIECVVVGAGGTVPNVSQLQELETYFNGDRERKLRGKLLMNTRLTGTLYTPRLVNVTATTYGGNITAIKTALTALLSPVAQESDGSWTWEFGGEVPVSRINAAIFNTTPRPRKVVIALPAADIALGARELPTVGTLTITVLP